MFKEKILKNYPVNCKLVPWIYLGVDCVVSNEVILRNLKNELLRIGTTNREEYDLLKEKGNLYSTSICRRLNLTWREIILKLGLKPARVLYPKEEMLTLLVLEFRRIGSYKKEVYRLNRDKTKFPHPMVLTKHLEMNWFEIIKACGCPNVTEFTADNVTDNELIDEYNMICERLGKLATVKDINEYSEYTYDIYRQHFGTMNELRKACGKNINDNKEHKIITKQECIEELRKLHNQYGELSYEELKKQSSISISTYFRRFKTTRISKIWEEILLKQEVK